MAYRETIKYLESFINYEKLAAWLYKESLKLDRMRGFLQAIGNPQEKLKCIHVAGSKGKGSTCAFIAYVLREAGFKTGLYTSPHLSDFRERIRILEPRIQGRGGLSLPYTATHPEIDFEGMISRRDLAQLVKRLRPAIERFNRRSKFGPLSFFEVYTALAFTYFKEKKVDFMVLETGLGGRLDATNVVTALVSVIAPISLEHTQKLGNTVAEIAGEKAGIIKGKLGQTPVSAAGVDGKPVSVPNSPIVITAPQEKEAMRVIDNKCREVGALLKRVKGYGLRVKVPLLGKHQIVNAACAIAAVKSLGIEISQRAIKNGIYNTRWPGRCEVIRQRPLVILDGCQNVASAKVIKKAVKENFRYKKLILVLGISKDKDIKGICAQMCDFSDEVILTRAGNLRAASPKDLKAHFSGRNVYLTRNVGQAKKKSLALAKKNDLVLVCGSLFVVGEFRQ